MLLKVRSFLRLFDALLSLASLVLMELEVHCFLKVSQSCLPFGVVGARSSLPNWCRFGEMFDGQLDKSSRSSYI
ncbi:hypothetical protein L2E82_44360 [Cichorium intybus]|uniref:Uncharacterized protein n=1 Tax=Cichorium intybus TaxID=13427 RepID=A0ACB8ZR31_CICIN|nr:hypothetical protein L2E82_44360 [Cichorium intybus]